MKIALTLGSNGLAPTICKKQPVFHSKSFSHDQILHIVIVIRKMMIIVIAMVILMVMALVTAIATVTATGIVIVIAIISGDAANNKKKTINV